MVDDKILMTTSPIKGLYDKINHLNRQETLLLIFDNFALKLKTWKSP